MLTIMPMRPEAVHPSSYSAVIGSQKYDPTNAPASTPIITDAINIIYSFVSFV